MLPSFGSSVSFRAGRWRALGCSGSCGVGATRVVAGAQVNSPAQLLGRKPGLGGHERSKTQDQLVGQGKLASDAGGVILGSGVGLTDAGPRKRRMAAQHRSEAVRPKCRSFRIQPVACPRPPPFVGPHQNRSCRTRPGPHGPRSKHALCLRLRTDMRGLGGGDCLQFLGQAKWERGLGRNLRRTAAGRSAATPNRAAPARISAMLNVAITSAPPLTAVSMTMSSSGSAAAGRQR